MNCISNKDENIFNDKMIMKCAIENEQYLGVANRKKGFKIAVYSLFICLFNKYHQIDSKRIFVVNGKHELKFEQQNDFTTIYYAVVSNKILSYRKIYTHVSNIKYVDRCKAIWRALLMKNSYISFGYALDYFLWKSFFDSITGEEIRVSGHYDRLTTQLANLARSSGIRFSIRQHGLLGEAVSIPHKLVVDEVLVFDKYEENIFRKNVIYNQDCKYSIDYKCSVKFTETPKKKRRIGIIELPIQEMEEIISVIVANNKEDEILVMMHPLSNNTYENLLSVNNIFFEKEKKEWNLDCIYSGPSTLVYDYVRAGYKNQIIVYDKPRNFSNITEIYTNIEVFQTLDEFKNKVKNHSS